MHAKRPVIIQVRIPGDSKKNENFSLISAIFFTCHARGR